MKKILACVSILLIIVVIGVLFIKTPIINKSKIEEPYTLEKIEIEFAKQLSSLINDDGTFVYDYYVQNHTKRNGYNILRHALSTWALIDYYERTNQLEKNKTQIKNALDFIVSQIVYKDEETAYVVDEEENNIKLGACGMSVVAFSRFEEAYKDNTYHDVMIKVANGILSMQKKFGGFYHYIDTDSFRQNNEETMIYYDGEAVLGLCKAYGITKEEKYLETAKKAMDYYIDNHYDNSSDHWQEYAANEISNYTDEVKYLEYGIRNVSSQFDKYKKKKRFDNVDYELFLNGKNVYEKYREKTSRECYEKDFTYEDLVNELNRRYDEIIQDFEMCKNVKESSGRENTVVEEFFIYSGNNSIRVDMLAHYLCGLKTK